MRSNRSVARNRVFSQAETLEPRMMLAADPIITEFMAENDRTLVDSFGDASDWIEIYNPDGAALDLTGWHLTDDPANLTKWQFPQGMVAAHDYLVVFASGADLTTGGGEIHTSFALDADGDYLALVRPDGTTIVSEYGVGGVNYPDQKADVSYGISQSVELIGPDDGGRFLVPSSGVLGSTWTDWNFDDAAWSPVEGPIGFDLTPNIPGLVSHWEFEGNFADSIGPNHGTGVGNATTIPDASRGGNVLSLDGDGDWVQTPPNLSLDFGSGNFTYSFWVKAIPDVDSQIGRSNFFMRSILTSPWNGVALQEATAATSNPPNFLRGLLDAGTPNVNASTSSFSVLDDVWHNVVWVVDPLAMAGGMSTIYVDGPCLAVNRVGFGASLYRVGAGRRQRILERTDGRLRRVVATAIAGRGRTVGVERLAAKHRQSVL
jgi:hypothetical protein